MLGKATSGACSSVAATPSPSARQASVQASAQNNALAKYAKYCEDPQKVKIACTRYSAECDGGMHGKSILSSAASMAAKGMSINRMPQKQRDAAKDAVAWAAYCQIFG